MKKNCAKKLGYCFFLFIFLVSGCSGKEKESEPQYNLSNVHATSNPSIAEKAKKYAISTKEVTAARAVNTDKDLYIAVKIKQMNRFQVKPIKKKIKEKLKTLFPDMKVHVSADKKIFSELDELEKRLDNPKMDKEKLQKELKRIKKDMKSDT
ncbi:YhcN/YlaJ family sporulation lipoprotein [Metabacillus sp. RGM 3146]|uniref:YhcN/YlaJ family sporulation lipoprotein n=1 Tax=Metabacillus sp. RGM 3146 TaxID=3401092 RepID=UPI003B99B112